MKKKIAMEKNKHFTRMELIKMARQKIIPDSEHLRACPSCREACDLLKAFPVAGDLPLPDAPSSWVDKAISLTEKTSLTRKIKSMVAEIIFDSWQSPQPVGVRGEALEEQRRIRYQADNLKFDMRAERVQGQWDFVGQITGPESSEIRLKIGKTEIRPDRHGFYQWSSKTPPARIIMHTSRGTIQLPRTKWTKSKSK